MGFIKVLDLRNDCNLKKGDVIHFKEREQTDQIIKKEDQIGAPDWLSW